MTPETIKELQKPLDPKHVRPPAPGKFGDYIEGWHAIAEANRIFGHDKWTRETLQMAETNRDRVGDKWFVGFMAKCRVTAEGVVRDGHGFGSGVSKNLGDAIESAVKEAETDAMKRALMTFGNPFGLALYDKSKANVGVFKPEWPEGPYKGVQAAKDAWRETMARLRECLDVETFDRIYAEAKPLLDQFRAAQHEWADMIPGEVEKVRSALVTRLANDEEFGHDPGAALEAEFPPADYSESFRMMITALRLSTDADQWAKDNGNLIEKLDKTELPAFREAFKAHKTATSRTTRKAA